MSTGAGQKEFNFTSTYYIYDDLGRLVVVITPEGFNKLVADGNFTVSASNDLWNYFYNYNKRGLISGKKLPGIDWSYLVYDQLNRAVLNQDPNQAVSGTWTYQKFDVSGRPIITGLVSLAGKTPSQLQDERWLSMAICSESRSESDNGYTNLAYPTTSLEEFTLKYYDDYDFNRDGNADFSPGNSEAARTRNKPTGNYAKVLGSVTALFEKNVLFYDYKGRVVETKAITMKERKKLNYSPMILQALYLKEAASITSLIIRREEALVIAAISSEKSEMNMIMQPG